MTPAAPRTSYRVTLAVLCLAGMSYSLLQSLVVPVLPTIQGELHTSETTVVWLLTGYLLSASVCTPILGRLGDSLGKERMLLVTLGLLAAGLVLAGVADSIGLLIVARLVQGGGGAIFPLAFGIIRDEFPREKVAGGIGIMAALLGVGGGLGIVLAGPIVEHLDYHWLFWFPLVPILLAMVLVKALVPESPVRSEGGISVTGGVLLSGWLVALLLGVSQGPTWGWLDARTLGLFALSVVLIVTWVAAESRAAHPLVDMTMMRLPTVWRANLVALLFGFGLYSSFALLPQFVQAPSSSGYGFGASVTVSGLFLLPSTIAMLVLGLYAGAIAARFGSRLPTVVGSVATTVAFGLLAVAHDTRVEVLIASALLGIGTGLAFSSLSNIVVAAVPADQTGIASGMNTNIRTIGGSLGGQITASIVVAGVLAGSVPKESGYTRAFGLLAVASLVAVVAAVLVPGDRPARGPVVADDAVDVLEAEDAAETTAPLAGVSARV